MGRGGRAVPTSGRECVAPGRGLRVVGQAFRPSAEHGRPEVGLELGAVVSAASSAEAQTRRHEHRSRSRSWPLSRRWGRREWLRVVGRGVALSALLRRLVERGADGSRERGRVRTPGAEPVGAGVRLTLGAGA